MPDYRRGMVEAPKRVVFFGTFDETTHPRVRVLAEAAAAAGYEVVVCNEPADISTAARVQVFSQPWRAPVLAVRIARSWLPLIRRARAIDRPVDAVVVGYLGVLDVHLARRLFDCPILLDQMAPVGGIGRDRRLPLVGMMDRLDEAAARRSDVVLVDTAEHLAQTDGRAEVVHVGAPDAWFESERRTTSRQPSGPISVCFFGLFTPLQGTQTIAEAIALIGDRPDLRWTLVGDGQDRAGAQLLLEHLRNVTWVDWIDSSELPRTVSQHDVCLGIFGTTDKAFRVVPNKVFQGAAAGCAIVTSDTPPQRLALGDAGVFVPAGDARHLADAIERLVEDPDRLRDRRNAARDRADAAITSTATAARLRAIIESATTTFSEIRGGDGVDR